MAKRLWLDDIRDPKNYGHDGANWVWVKTAEDAVRELKTGQIDFASLDHDLTEEQMVRGGFESKIHDDGVKSGYDVVCWLEENEQYWPPDGTVVHSANPAGRARMQQVIDRFYTQAR